MVMKNLGSPVIRRHLTRNDPGFIRRKFISILVVMSSLLIGGCAEKKDPLFRATQDGEVNTVRALLDGGADINRRNETGLTPLILAAMKNHKELVQLLVDRGADANARNSKGETALTLAARDGHPEIAQTLLRKGADVNVEDNAGMAPVVYATQFNHPATLKVLLEEGRADVSGERGKKALRSAQGHPDLIELLKKAGARE